VPEGDTIFRTATALRRWLGGRRITTARSGVPGLDASRLVGRSVDTVETRGKHLLIRLSGGLSVHTHMRMTGSWHVYPAGEPWRKPVRQARLVLAAGERVAVCFNAPTVELLGARDERSHPSLRRLGPDVVAPEAPDPVEVRRRARIRAAASPTIAELLLDQQMVSGIGNVYRSECLFLCGLHPATAVAELRDDQLDDLVATASRLMRVNARATSAPSRSFGPSSDDRGLPSAGRTWVYRRNGRPCRRCGSPVRRGLLGPQARAVYWCPVCQAARAPAAPGAMPGPAGQVGAELEVRTATTADAATASGIVCGPTASCSARRSTTAAPPS